MTYKIELAEKAGEMDITRQSVAEMKAGKVRPAEEMLAEMRQIIDEKRGE